MRIVADAGPKVQERLFPVVFRWRDKDHAASSNSVVKNPRLVEGGFSPDTECQVCVRDSEFSRVNGTYRPRKGDACSLTTTNGVFATNRLMRVQTIEQTEGDGAWLLTLGDANQGA